MLSCEGTEIITANERFSRRLHSPKTPKAVDELMGIALESAFSVRPVWLEVPKGAYSIVYADTEYVYKVVLGHSNDLNFETFSPDEVYIRVCEYADYIAELKRCNVRVPDKNECRMIFVQSDDGQFMPLSVERQSRIHGATDMQKLIDERLSVEQQDKVFTDAIDLAFSMRQGLGITFGFDFAPGNIFSEEKMSVDFYPPHLMPHGLDYLMRKIYKTTWKQYSFESYYTFGGALRYIFTMYTALRPERFARNKELLSQKLREYGIDLDVLDKGNAGDLEKLGIIDENMMSRDFGCAVAAYDRFGVDLRKSLTDADVSWDVVHIH